MDYDDGAGVGFIRADDGGPTYFFRWDAIRIDAHFKTLAVGARVAFDGYTSHAGERFALDVSPEK
jgi:cold shock CspA family protein